MRPISSLLNRPGKNSMMHMKLGSCPVNRHLLFAYIRFFAYIRRVALPVMGGAFGLYVVMHSPLRNMLAPMFGLKSESYFVCGEALSLSGIAESAAAWALIAIAGLAAWVVAERFDGAPYESPLVFGLSGMAFIVGPAAAIGGIATWGGIGLLRPPVGPLLSVLPAALVV